MKKKYKAPMAEMVEFDYKDSVAACFSAGQGQGQGNNNQSGNEQENCQPGESWWVDTNANNTSNTPYWGC